jgi:hypothetical protein
MVIDYQLLVFSLITYSHLYHCTLSRLAVIKLFLKMLKFKEITREGKNTKIGGNLEAELFLPIHHCKTSIQ